MRMNEFIRRFKLAGVISQRAFSDTLLVDVPAEMIDVYGNGIRRQVGLKFDTLSIHVLAQFNEKGGPNVEQYTVDYCDIAESVDATGESWFSVLIDRAFTDGPSDVSDGSTLEDVADGELLPFVVNGDGCLSQTALRRMVTECKSVRCF